MGLYLNWFKSYDTKCKYFPFCFFFQFCKNLVICLMFFSIYFSFVFCVCVGDGLHLIQEVRKLMSVLSREGDQVWSRREQVNKWRLPCGIRFHDNGSADQTGTAEKEFYLMLSQDNHDESTKVFCDSHKWVSQLYRKIKPLLMLEKQKLLLQIRILNNVPIT